MYICVEVCQYISKKVGKLKNCASIFSESGLRGTLILLSIDSSKF